MQRPAAFWCRLAASRRPEIRDRIRASSMSVQGGNAGGRDVSLKQVIDWMEGLFATAIRRDDLPFQDVDVPNRLLAHVDAKIGSARQRRTQTSQNRT